MRLRTRPPLLTHLLTACPLVYRSREVILNRLCFLGCILQSLIGVEKVSFQVGR